MMKARIVKKLSKRIKELLPKDYEGSWINEEIMCEAWVDKNTINHCLMIGGELDCWGEGTDDYTILEHFKTYHYDWGIWGLYPEGHKWEGLPLGDPKKRRVTGKFIIEVAKIISIGGYK
jgi:hypothetical protein